MISEKDRRDLRLVFAARSHSSAKVEAFIEATAEILDSLHQSATPAAQRDELRELSATIGAAAGALGQASESTLRAISAFGYGQPMAVKELLAAIVASDHAWGWRLERGTAVALAELLRWLAGSAAAAADAITARPGPDMQWARGLVFQLANRYRAIFGRAPGRTRESVFRRYLSHLAALDLIPGAIGQETLDAVLGNPPRG